MAQCAQGFHQRRTSYGIFGIIMAIVSCFVPSYRKNWEGFLESKLFFPIGLICLLYVSSLICCPGSAQLIYMPIQPRYRYQMRSLRCTLINTVTFCGRFDPHVSRRLLVKKKKFFISSRVFWILPWKDVQLGFRRIYYLYKWSGHYHYYLTISSFTNSFFLILQSCVSIKKFGNFYLHD